MEIFEKIEKKDKSEPLIPEKDEITKQEKYEKYTYSKDAFNNSSLLNRFGRRTPIKLEHLGSLDECNRCNTHFLNLKSIWNKYKKSEKYGLLKAIIYTNFMSLIWILILNIFEAGLGFINIILLKSYITFFVNYEKNVTAEYSPMFIGTSLCAFKLISVLIGRQVSFYQSYCGYKANSELNCLIYSKVLSQSPADNKVSSGEIINLIQSDSVKLALLMETCTDLIIMPVQIIIYNIFLFNLLGVSYLPAFIILVITFIFLIFSVSIQRENLRNIAKAKDSRMKATTELINSLKILKIYAWEDYFLSVVNERREEELKYLSARFKQSALIMFIYWCVPVVLCVVSIGFLQILKVEMNLAEILTAVTIFSMLQEPISGYPWVSSLVFEVLNSLERIEKYLKLEDIDKSKLEVNSQDYDSGEIIVKNGNFSWDYKKYFSKVDEDSIINISPLTASTALPINQEQLIKLNTPNTLKNINIKIQNNELVAVIGDVGSGKSSLLQAILNNLSSGDESKINLNGKVSYLSQIPWIQNDTLRNNILFQKEYDAVKYDKVFEMCELSADVESLICGDMTEIGEKGVNLSGGQKARVSLARAIYNDSDIYLFDDIIAALDSHVGQKIMTNCILNYLKDKTRVLVTHSLQYLDNMDRIIYMSNGEIKWQGIYEELIKQEFFHFFSLNVKKVDENVKEDEEVEEIKPYSRIGKTMLEETKEEGTVKFGIYYKYIQYSGGLLYFALCCWQAMKIYNDIWLASWAKKENLSSEANWEYFKVFAIVGLTSPVFLYFRMHILSKSGLKCSRKLHSGMITSIVRAPINLFHDIVPKGQILNRFSKDLCSVDTLVYTIGPWFIFLISFLGAVIVCSIYMYYSIFFFAFCLILGIYITRFCLYASRELERLEGITRSPILNLLSETISGAITIRAYEKEETFMTMFCEKVNTYFKIRIFLHGVENWFGLSLDFISLFFLIFLFSITITFKDSFSSNAIALMLSYSVLLEKALFKFLSSSTKLENLMVSMERCVEYNSIQSEGNFVMPKDKEIEKHDWRGKISFEDYSVRYRPNTPLVLKQINLVINPGEKVGIVGRTGSGKSTICLSLFRILEPDTGRILIDDIDITSIGLKLLRGSLTIIPQDPTLLDGSLRSNIDPLESYSDKEILNVLNMIGFTSRDLTLDIKESGSNLSVGEKQLVCIARAILRKSKVIVMDEATANIDYKTDELIQKTIREVMRNSTVITIAHRIKTILNYDRIVVLNYGEVVEFDTPEKLITNQNSYFYELYSKSNI